MNSSRVWTLGAVVAAAAILGGGAALGVQPQLAAAASADATTKQVQQANDATQVELTRLAKVAARQADLVQEEQRLGSAVTGSLRLNTFSRQVRTAAALNSVKVVALDPGAGKVYTPPTSAAAAAGTTGTASSASGSSSSTTSTPAPVVATPGQFGAQSPLITSANYTIVPVTITVTGTEAGGIAFAQDVQHMSRLFAVDTVTYSKGSGADTVPSTTISGNIYALKG